jgi:ethanolamine utilization protein EutM
LGGVILRAALGIIETIGYTTAVTALDAAAKAADITLVGYDKVIGLEKAIGVSVHIAGEVAAVKAAVEAGVAAASRTGRVVSHHVIARPHEEVDRLIAEFEKNLNQKKNSTKVESAKASASAGSKKQSKPASVDQANESTEAQQ